MQSSEWNIYNLYFLSLYFNSFEVQENSKIMQNYKIQKYFYYEKIFKCHLHFPLRIDKRYTLLDYTVLIGIEALNKRRP